jgi:hypothetical protein
VIVLSFDVESWTIFRPCGVELTILLEENAFPEEPSLIRIALEIELFIVFPSTLL